MTPIFFFPHPFLSSLQNDFPVLRCCSRLVSCNKSFFWWSCCPGGHTEQTVGKAWRGALHSQSLSIMPVSVVSGYQSKSAHANHVWPHNYYCICRMLILKPAAYSFLDLFSSLICRATRTPAGVYKTTWIKTVLEVGKEWKEVISISIPVDVEGNLPSLIEMRFRSDPSPTSFFRTP